MIFQKLTSVGEEYLRILYGVLLLTFFLCSVAFSQVNQQKILDYDDYGNPIEVQDANGNVTKFYFGSKTLPFSQAGHNGTNGVYLTGIQKVKGSSNCNNCGSRPTSGDDLFTEAEYDDFGRLVKLIDENGLKKDFDYDSFGRLNRTWNSNDFLTSSNSYFYSSIANNGIYSASNPNSVQSISYSGFSTDGLVGHWQFDGNALDNSKNEINGILYGSSDVNQKGYFGRGLSLLGSNSDYANLGNNSSLRPDWITIMGWVKPNSSTGPTQIVTQENYGYRFSYEYGGIRLLIKLNDSDQANQWGEVSYLRSNIISPNEWNHIAVSFGDDRRIRIYVNGELEGTSQEYTGGGGKITYTGSASTTVGRGNSSSWRGPFYGSIDELKIYNRALSLAEIEADYKAVIETSYLDGLGRPIQTQQRGVNNTIISATQYNDRGLPEVVSRPFEVPDQDTYLSNPFGSSFNPPGLSGWDYGSHLDNEYDGTSGGSNYPFTYTKYENSPMSRVVESRLPGGGNYDVKTSYELNDTETFATAAQGGTSAKTWTANTLQKTLTEDPEGKQTITYTDGWGQTIASGVDMNTDGKLTRGSDDLVTEFSYDLRGNLVRSEDPRGLATTYTYDERNLLVEKKLPDQTHPHTYRYDDKGRLRFHRDPKMNTTGRLYYTKYDELDRPIEVGKYNSTATFFNDPSYANNQSFPTGGITPYIEYSYDGDNAATNANNLRGRLTKVEYKDLSTGIWGSTSYSYNDLGLVEWVIQDVPGLNGEHTIEYTYDGLGRKTQLVYNPPGTGNDHYTWYYYDELGRLEEVTSNTSSNESNAQSEATYSYTADSQPSQLILGGGVQTVDYRYRVQGWISSINSVYSMSSDAFALNLSYKNNGNISYQQWKQPGISTSYNRYYYSYDTANRLESACYAYSTCDQGDYDVNYTYDKNGNIKSIARYPYTDPYDSPVGGYFYNYFLPNTNKISLSYNTGVGRSFSYDANGNMTENNLQGITSASYDWRNLPYSLTASSTMEYGYDAQGNRVRKEMVGGVEMHYVQGAEGETVAVYEDGSRDFVNLLANNEVIGIWTGSERRYFLKDHLGSTRTTVNENGNIIGYDDYYPFGLGMPTRSDNTGNGTATYKFTGHERDDEAEITLDYMMARNYDPVLGRFMQIDPKSAKFPDWSPYNYTMNNPINMWDPDGNAPMSCCLDYSARYVALNRDAAANGKDPVQYIESYHSAQAVNTGTFSAGLASLFIPGPEDAVFLTLMATKPAQALGRIGAKAGGAIKNLFRSGDEFGKQIGDITQGLKNVRARKGDFGLGEMTSGDARELGEAFVGPNSISIKKGDKVIGFRSEDGTRVFRFPAEKTRGQAAGKVQANIEEFTINANGKKKQVRNAHIDIIEQ